MYVMKTDTDNDHRENEFESIQEPRRGYSNVDRVEKDLLQEYLLKM